mmetsp:Transcript_6157/g.38238  ORF Transcript_6157/g.38238 Transcript_6157/m.38238 type:complete len:84 (+) Transcript_6157:607-858(+)
MVEHKLRDTCTQSSKNFMDYFNRSGLPARLAGRFCSHMFVGPLKGNTKCRHRLLLRTEEEEERAAEYAVPLLCALTILVHPFV